MPDPLSVCYFVCSGTEANELAIRLARTHTGGHDFIVVDGAYHGNSSGVVDLSPYKFNGPGGKGAPSHVQVVPTPDTFRGRYRNTDKDIGLKYASHVAQALKTINSGGRKSAGFFAEPIMGCAGQIIPPPGYLKESFAYVRAMGGVCIADEVQVGFGRVGTHFWAFETQDIVPDIVTLGKPIGNGHPLAAVVTTPEIAASFANGMEYFNTFGGNPISCAIGMAVLDVIENERLQENALHVGEYLKQELTALSIRHPVIGDVRGMGLFLGVELVESRETLVPASAVAKRVVEQMKDAGVLVSTDGPDENVIKIRPPLVFNKKNADQLVMAMNEALRSVV
jgi:ethanolamine-phosphate phospho-lyase